MTPQDTNSLHFYLNMLFKNMVCILALLSLTTVLATFQKIGPIFSKFLVTLQVLYQCAKTASLKVGTKGQKVFAKILSIIEDLLKHTWYHHFSAK